CSLLFLRPEERLPVPLNNASDAKFCRTPRNPLSAGRLHGLYPVGAVVSRINCEVALFRLKDVQTVWVDIVLVIDWHAGVGADHTAEVRCIALVYRLINLPSVSILRPEAYLHVERLPHPLRRNRVGVMPTPPYYQFIRHRSSPSP